MRNSIWVLLEYLGRSARKSRNLRKSTEGTGVYQKLESVEKDESWKCAKSEQMAIGVFKNHIVWVGLR